MLHTAANNCELKLLLAVSLWEKSNVVANNLLSVTISVSKRSAEVAPVKTTKAKTIKNIPLNNDLASMFTVHYRFFLSTLLMLTTSSITINNAGKPTKIANPIFDRTKTKK